MRDRIIVARHALLALAAVIASPAWAANERTVQYGFFSGAGPTRQDETQTVNLNAGQTLSVNRSNMNFVRNTGGNKVDVTLTGAISNKFTLDKDQRNPSAGFYLTPVTLVSLHCTHGATVSAPSTPEQLVNQLKQANAGVNQIAQQLKTTFNQTGQQVAGLLKAAGYGASQVAAAVVLPSPDDDPWTLAWLPATAAMLQRLVLCAEGQVVWTAYLAADTGRYCPPPRFVDARQDQALRWQVQALDAGGQARSASGWAAVGAR